MTCPKCGAGRANLHTFTEHLASGEILETERCLLCSTRRSRVVQNPSRRRVGNPFEAGGTTAAEQAELRSKASAARRRAVTAGSKPCAVPGCGGTYYAARPCRPLCKTHRNRLDTWERNRRKGQLWAAPLVLVNGHWLERGQPLPLDPPPVDPPAPKRRRAVAAAGWVARCEGCRKKTAIAAWNLCAPCLDRQRGEVRHG